MWLGSKAVLIFIYAKQHWTNEQRCRLHNPTLYHLALLNVNLCFWPFRTKQTALFTSHYVDNVNSRHWQTLSSLVWSQKHNQRVKNQKSHSSPASVFRHKARLFVITQITTLQSESHFCKSLLHHRHHHHHQSYKQSLYNAVTRKRYFIQLISFSNKTLVGSCFAEKVYNMAPLM